ncbi:unnamed protein product, partial [Prorocentrum cordatum]
AAGAGGGGGAAESPPEGEGPSRFAHLRLSEGTQRAISEGFKYDELSRVQQRVLPLALSTDSDVVVRAHTGTGKTLAFLVPAVEAQLVSRGSGGVGTLVVAPTRELCLQIGREAEVLLAPHRAGVVTLISGGAEGARGRTS